MRTRFAPSPTGPLHLGHGFSALKAWDMAQAAGGEFLLRIEDIDGPRCRAEYEAAIYEDLRWLGLAWPEPVMRQSQRLEAYGDALARLDALGLVYPCTCTRADIAMALSAPQEGAPGPDGPVYPGTCRGRGAVSGKAAMRLDMARAIECLGGADAVADLVFEETGEGFAGLHRLDVRALVSAVGDVVLARRDIGTSYHLAVVVDDAAQGVTDVVRGEDLADATPLHRLLQALVGLPVPRWHHHRLIRDEGGRRLAKRDDARSLAKYRAEGMTSEGLRALLVSGDRV